MSRALVACSLLAVTSACVSFNYVRFRHGEPVDDAALASLVPGESNLGTCLTQLGAPEIVWESQRGEIRLAYAWLDGVDWGFGVSYSFARFVSVRFDLDSSAENVEAVVLTLDSELRLRSVRRGYLRALVPIPEDPDPTGSMLRNAPR